MYRFCLFPTTYLSEVLFNTKDVYKDHYDMHMNCITWLWESAMSSLAVI